MISINIKKENDYLVIAIEDNGVDCEQAIANNPSPGRGIKMTRDFYEILNQSTEKPVSFIIFDLTEGERATGTKVVVRLPASQT